MTTKPGQVGLKFQTTTGSDGLVSLTIGQPWSGSWPWPEYGLTCACGVVTVVWLVVA